MAEVRKWEGVQKIRLSQTQGPINISQLSERETCLNLILLLIHKQGFVVRHGARRTCVKCSAMGVSVQE
jgi:hypothetical protein